MTTTTRTFMAMTAAVMLAVSLAPQAARAGGKDGVMSMDDLPRDTRMALFEAQQYVQGVNYSGAVNSLEEYLSEHPGEDNFWMRFFLGDYYTHLEEDEKAFDQLEKCVALEPRFAQGWLKLGEVAYSLQRYGRAGEAILRGFDLDEEKRPELLYFSGASYILAEQPAKALPVLDRLIGGDFGEPRLEWYRAAISAAIETQELDEGRATVDRMLATFAEDPDAWYLAFQYEASVSDYEQAAVALTVVGYLRPLSRQEQIQLGDLYSAIDIPVVAGEYYRSAVADSASARDVERLASAYIASYNQEDALAVLTRAVREEPTARLYSLLGDLQFMRKDYDASYDAFAQCTRLDAEEGRAFLMMGYCAMELERNEDAVASLERALAFEDVADRAQSLLERARRRLGSNAPVGAGSPTRNKG